eukprot:CAMPEP_0172680282 /NCGR_PEP_ID=MMETSP1074-20121228/16669_1 /TAXON_ID=2916 /ORGANISM="Ceratium fusus, Strain PA161109" /LENGTH=184 /DNA_ID=CAMNT_0013498591 /DNA_START=55 /DNA_END=609 /DNA_ORIENTATION=+
MGDGTNARSCGAWSGALADCVLFPILSMFNYSLPKCGDDASVGSNRDQCPDTGQVPWWTGISGPARNDTRLLLQDPRDGPLLPFTFQGMDDWNVTDSNMPDLSRRNVSGAAMFGVRCRTYKECWKEYVLKRFHEKPRPGEAPVLSFVRHTQCDEPETRSREALLAAKDSYFYNLLRLSGLAASK